MSDVINSIFGRPKNETPGSGGYGYGASEPVAEVATEQVDTEESEEATAESTTDSAPETDSAEEIAEDEPAVAETEDTAEAVETEDDTEDTAEAVVTDDDLVEDEDRVAEPAAEPVTEPAVTEPVVAEPVVAEAAPVAEETEPVVAEAEAIVAEAEPLVAAETRPAAGSRGSTTVADGVVVKLVTRVAAKAEGVHELDEAGISVDVDGEVVTIAITLVVEFGRAVKELAEQIRIKLIEAVEQYLGLEVAIVDVHVADIHFPETD
ncbi:Asp23/Gls24 family envelope stress response protein [Amycolatopsis sp. NPDC051758]|uniref:Asp23/Gls24 family envelope stress response protein n=1 Tax=Amycolatopsis sp. NPDC051758 TaxID=3363935 RepID=UPI0037A2ABCF